MGRIKSERQVKNDGMILTQDDYLLVSFTPISFLLYILAMIGSLYITIKYYGKDPYANYSLMAFILGIISFLGIIYINQESVIRFQYRFLKEPVMWVFFVIVLMFFLSLGWAITKTQVRYALSTTDMYFYYISIAIIEEMFFRMFMCSLLKIRFKLNIVLVIIISSFFFMLIHLEYYGDNPAFLGMMFVGGILFALVYLYTKDISITMVAHVLVNIFAVGNLLITT